VNQNHHVFYHMKNYISLLAFSMLFTALSCNHKTVTDASSQDEQLDTFKNIYVEEIFRISPGAAMSAGRHDYDSVLQVPSAAAYKNSVADWNKLLDTLNKYDETRLNEANQIDLKIMKDNLEGSIWAVNVFREYEWNPATFNACGNFAEILNGRYAPLNDRLRAFSKRLTFVPAYYEAAKNLITTPVIEHTDLAILQNEGAVEEAFGQAFRDSVATSTVNDAEKEQLLARAEVAKAAVTDYTGWLKTKRAALTPENSRSFRIGKELYDAKFKYEIVSDFTPEDIYKRAVKRRSELHAEMAKLSRELWPKYFKDQPMPQDSLVLIRKMIDALSYTHVKPELFLQSIEKQMPELISFINEKKLLYIDPSKPLVVRKTPAYMEGGGAGASISAPGPFDKNADTYYNVSPLTGYSPEQAESYLREYNQYILQILNIHEAIPGHYTQLVYSNNSPSIIKSLFGNGAMVEGWAVYAERMMIENGYGGNTPEMWLMYYKWHLRSVCNTILDYSVHVLNMSEADAKNLLINGAFQQEEEANGKWRRVKLTQVQLCCYFTGFTEIYELREELKRRQGDKFNLKEFHEKFLSYGSAPVKYIKALMLSPDSDPVKK
jgi:uncharacterized protein (DUF885 family)